jgi:ribosomal protein S18 acetylase RimI-like enzyme
MGESGNRTLDIQIEMRLPTPEEHRRLAEGVGWAHGFNWTALPESLDASLAGVVALDGHRVVGMGRLIGDGHMYFYIQDVAVDPGFQGHGIGHMIVEALLRYIRETAPGPVFVGLFATDAALTLYQRNGFSKGDMTGMFRIVEPATEGHS